MKILYLEYFDKINSFPLGWQQGIFEINKIAF